MLVVNHPEALKYLKPEHEMVLYDDAAFSKLDKEQLLALLETGCNKQVRVLYELTHKQAGLIQLIALNPSALKKMKHKLLEPQFLRRIHLLPVSNDFIINVNLNVHLHQHTHIYNNEHRIQKNRQVLKQIRESYKKEKATQN